MSLCGVEILGNVIFVADVKANNNAAQIEACFVRLGVKYERRDNAKGVANFYCTENDAERVSNELDAIGEEHEWGLETTVPVFPPPTKT